MITPPANQDSLKFSTINATNTILVPLTLLYQEETLEPEKENLSPCAEGKDKCGKKLSLSWKSTAEVFNSMEVQARVNIQKWSIKSSLQVQWPVLFKA